MENDGRLSPGWMIFLGIVMIIGGIAAIAMPYMMTWTAVTFLGVILCVVGGFQIVAAFQAGSWGAGIGGALGGVLYLLAGIMTIGRPVTAAAVITLILGMVLIFRGAMHIGLSLDLRPEKGWGWVMFGGVLGILLGILLLVKWPSTGVWFIGLVVGIEILWSGWSLVFMGMAVKDLKDEVKELGDGEPPAQPA